MAFCRFSSSYIIDDKTIIDNVFINDHLPYAPELCVKVYLMGLSKCGNASAGDNNIENFAKVLNVTVEEIEMLLSIGKKKVWYKFFLLNLWKLYIFL